MSRLKALRQIFRDQLTHLCSHPRKRQGGIDQSRAGQAITFERLLDLTTKRLERLKYDQRPCMTLPSDRANEKIPWRSTTPPGAKTGGL